MNTTSTIWTKPVGYYGQKLMFYPTHCLSVVKRPVTRMSLNFVHQFSIKRLYTEGRNIRNRSIKRQHGANGQFLPIGILKGVSLSWRGLLRTGLLKGLGTADKFAAGRFPPLRI
jgi:hypothetical protein